ncbi:uncharacterized protein [Amphiura filiformis]|uniref:uncharacterized protein n=1 Tax=Amphiura filiformis TaxID=82378 RepID=UPI003B228924
MGGSGDIGSLTGEMEEIVLPNTELEIWVPTDVNGEAATFLLDTGTSHTIVTLEMFLLIPEERRPRLDVPNVILKQAAGSRVKVWGRAALEVTVGKKRVKLLVVVGQVTSDMLGMDFLRATEPKLDFGLLQLQWEDCIVQCATTPGAVRPPRLLAVNDTEVPAGHSMIVSALVSGLNSEKETLGVVEPLGRSRLIERGILVARCVVKAQDRVVPVTVANVGNRPYVIKHGTTLAKIAEVEEGEVCETRTLTMNEFDGEEVGPKDGGAIQGMPPYLEELARRSTDGLDLGDRAKVKGLLIAYQDVFSSGEFDIGRTTWVKHNIDTGDAAPIRQRVRRSSPQQRAEVERQVGSCWLEG